MQQKIEWLQAQLGDLKGKSKDTSCVSDTLNPLSQKLENKNVELEFQVSNYAKENAHLKTTYKNLFDSISVTRTRTKTIIVSLQNKLQDMIYGNAKLKAQLFDKVSDQKDTTCGKSANTKFAKQSMLGKPSKVGETHALSKLVTSNSIPTPQGSNVVQNDKVIAPGMFRINPFTPSKEEEHAPNKVRASVRTKPITVSQPPVITKKVLNSDSNGLSSTRVDNIKTRRPQPRSNTKNDRQCLNSVNHDVCLLNYVNGMNSRGKKQKVNVSINEHQKKQKTKVKKTKKVGSIERLASPKPSKPRSFLRWSPTRRLFDLKGKIIASSESESQSDCSKGDNACTSNPLEPTIKRFPNSTFSLAGTVRFENDHVAAILGFGQFCDSDLEVAFRRNACFIRNLEGVDLFVQQTFTPSISIKWPLHLQSVSWLVLLLPSHDYGINEHLYPSCEQGKSKRASHPSKPVSNSRQRLHLLHMDLCGPMRIASINGKRYVLVIMDNYSRYTWSPVIIIRTDNDTEFKNQALKEYFDSVSISHQMSSVRTPQQNRVMERRNQTLVEAARTMLNFSRAPIFLWAKAIATAALCYPKNDREDIGKLGAKGDIGFFIGYSVDFCAYRRSSKPGLQSMTSGQINSGLDLTYAPSTITTQQTTEGELDLLFEAIYDDYIGGQPSTAPRTVPATQAHQVRNQDLIQPKTVADNVLNAMFDANMFVNPFATPSTSAAESSSSQYVDLSNMHKFYQPYPHEFQCTKDHPLEQVIGEPSRPVLTRNQLRSDGDMCMYALTVSSMEPKNVKEAMTDPAWIELIQGELPYFKRLDSNYVLEILKKYGMESYDPVGTPMEIKDKLNLDQNGTPVDATKYRSMIGALMYLTSSRPDIVHATCLCARYQAKPTEKHLKKVKRIFRYLWGTVNTSLWYTKAYDFELTGFSDADYAGCKDTFKSTSGGAQFLGEKLVRWSSKKQDCTALSTAEAEYVSLSACCTQVLWMQTQLTDYGFHFNKIPIYCDSK
uniref:Uncharacterized mitochondrial protein AtMg00810-like n=1 Tax=Tanacetum cinerariifolium TaxID=118510 RepID=A0A6L2M345_TANCI|nr:uncharacterized mitochondrial protein AtMg00810-like [Tanacetum cinerariifolium]